MPFLYSDYLYKWLDNCLDFGLTEADFWNMTLAEIDRAVKSKQRQIESEDKRRASFDYILADLIGRSISRVYSSSAKMPALVEAYPTLFNNEEVETQKAAKLQELSAIRFRQFAQAFNNKLGGAKVTDG